MKTVEEFIQRLQNDPEFERKARAFENSDEFMEFVKSAGYDFTLDQLLVEFHHEPEMPKPPVEGPPVGIKTVEEFIQRLQSDPEFKRQARAFENSDEFLEFVQREGYGFTLDQLMKELKPGQVLLGPQADGPPTTLKNRIIAIPRMPDGVAIKKQAEPALHGVEEPQKRSGTLSPNFEGIVGGRRRGMKWRIVDRDET